MEQLNQSENIHKIQDYKIFKQKQQIQISNQSLNRKILQFKAKQQLSIDDQDFILQNSDQQVIEKVIKMKQKPQIKQKGRADNLWNDMTQISMKNAKLFYNSNQIKTYEQAYEKIASRIIQDNDKYQNYLRQRRESHDNQYLNFMEKKIRKKIETNPNDVETSLNNFNNKIKEIEQNINAPQDKFSEILVNSREFNGLFVGDIDADQIIYEDIPIIQQFKKSKLLQNKIELLKQNKCKNQSYQQKTTKKVSKDVQNEDIKPQELLKEIDEFQHKFNLDQTKKTLQCFARFNANMIETIK